MESVEGETLAKRLEKGPLPVKQVLKLGAEIADALDKAHRSGVVHRDLKPGNIMLTPGGARVLDFGLAKLASPLASLATLTATKQESPVSEEAHIELILDPMNETTSRRMIVEVTPRWRYIMSERGIVFSDSAWCSVSKSISE